MPKYNLEEKYSGHQNNEIKTLINTSIELDKEKRRIEDKINEIRENCDHNFQFYCSGMYEDTYYCEYCGQEEWN